MCQIKNLDTKEFIEKMIEKAKKGEVAIRRSEPCRETKYTYHYVIQDPETKRVIVGTGGEAWGDDFSYAFEIDPSTMNSYL